MLWGGAAVRKLGIALGLFLINLKRLISIGPSEEFFHFPPPLEKIVMCDLYRRLDLSPDFWRFREPKLPIG